MQSSAEVRISGCLSLVNRCLCLAWRWLASQKLTSIRHIDLRHCLLLLNWLFIFLRTSSERTNRNAWFQMVTYSSAISLLTMLRGMPLIRRVHSRLSVSTCRRCKYVIVCNGLFLFRGLVLMYLKLTGRGHRLYFLAIYPQSLKKFLSLRWLL